MSNLKKLGPGLLYAGAAIGVSHIVQSTRAGAEYGYVLIIAIVLAHIFKYPFFAVGPRYANLSGENLIQGYTKLHKSVLWLLFLLTVSTMFTIQAAVTVVTAGLAQKLTGIDLPTAVWSGILLAICYAILQIGRFGALDKLMKVIMILLAISTVLAVAFSFRMDGIDLAIKPNFSLRNPVHIAFLIAFIGWMPAPLDISIWHSIWTRRKYEEEGERKLATENFDFKTGFYGTAFLAICFLVLGANTLFSSGIELEASAGKFAGQLVDIYTSSLGSWSYYIIVIAAFTTMFSTTLTCFDALPRVMQAIVGESKTPQVNALNKKGLWMIVLAIGVLIILGFYVENMKQMVTIATVVSFLTAPILAGLSILLVRKSKYASSIWNRRETQLAFVGFLFLLLFSVYYLSILL
ncbi:MAG: divalent metal cation transporter [Bacteroidia bacterium]